MSRYNKPLESSLFHDQVFACFVKFNFPVIYIIYSCHGPVEFRPLRKNEKRGRDNFSRVWDPG